MDVTSKLAGRTHQMGINGIREILKVVSRPGMMSLAGGNPPPESLPLALMQHLTESVVRKYGASAFQYDCTEGFGPLREVLVDYLSDSMCRVTSRDILVSSGSQGVLDALGTILISKDDIVAVESPTYIGALQAFAPCGPKYIRLAVDEDGLIPEALEEALRSNVIKIIYLVPTFQNPTGRTLSMKRRQAVAQLIKQYDTLLVEDDPYSALRYRGQSLPTIKSMAPEHVVYVSTLSKIFAPGLRIGFCVAPESLRKWLVVVKQGVDLHTSTLSQALAAEYISGGYLKSHLPSMIELYKTRQEAMLTALKRYFSPRYTWSRPQGGMFIWVQGPSGTDMMAVYRESIKHNVAFVPGTYFYTRKGQGRETMRLNFTLCDEKTLDSAVCLLAGVVDRVSIGA